MLQNKIELVQFCSCCITNRHQSKCVYMLQSSININPIVCLCCKTKWHQFKYAYMLKNRIASVQILMNLVCFSACLNIFCLAHRRKLTFSLNTYSLDCKRKLTFSLNIFSLDRKRKLTFVREKAKERIKGINEWCRRTGEKKGASMTRKRA